MSTVLQASTRGLQATFDGARCTVIRDNLTWARFDLTGRWTAGLMDGVTWRRALSGRVLAIRGMSIGPSDASTSDQPERFHEVVEIGAPESLHETARDLAHAALALPEVQADAPHPLPSAAGRALCGEDGLSPTLAWRQLLQRALTIDLAADAERFRAIYTGEPILPPDRAQDLVVQSTVGCKHNDCTFCTLYEGVRFSIRRPSQFAQHVHDVTRFLGPALAGKRGIFLGDASPITANIHTLTTHLEMVSTILRGRLNPRLEYGPGHPWHAPPEAVRAFCDAFVSPMRELDELRALHDLGLHRVYLGVETGCDALLDFLHKPACADHVLTLSQRLKTAGIRRSVLIMSGVGGDQFADRHVADTVKLLKEMRLDPGDAVVFSEFFPVPGYEDHARDAGITPLTRPQCRNQMRTLMRALDLPSKTGPRVQMYDARQLLY